MTERVDVVVIGAGFAGLGAAWRLLDAGITDWVLLERASEVGGTWRDNTYPGAACDIRSDLYSLSFAPNPSWTTSYGHQPEILEYLKRLADRPELRERIRFDTELEKATWNAAGGRWRLKTSRGELSARVVLSGHGPLIDPQLPDIPGLATFAGAIFHSARWDHSVDLTGKRVAVIGTGASAIQIVPALQPIVGHLDVMQRTPAWIIPRGDRATSWLRRRAFAAMPALQRVSRDAIFRSNDARWFGFAHPAIGKVIQALALFQLNRQVHDKQLRARLRPSYRIGCKRILVSDDFYPALQQPNVDLVTSPITRIEPDRMVTADGIEHEVDAIVLATGFDATAPAIAKRYVGVNGSTLAQAWAGGMFALRGSTIPGFPNLFLLQGPNASLGHNSAVFMIEAQIEYALAALTSAPPDAVLDARTDATTNYNRWLDRSLDKGVWATGGCTSFYLDPSGRNTVLWPRRAAQFRAATRRFNPREYVISEPVSVESV